MHLLMAEAWEWLRCKPGKISASDCNHIYGPSENLLLPFCVLLLLGMMLKGKRDSPLTLTGPSERFLPGEVGFFPAGNWPDSRFILHEDVASNFSAEPNPSHEVKGSQGFSCLK